MRIKDILRRSLLLYHIFVKRTRPIFYCRLMLYILERFFLNRHIPITVMIAVTYKCQCRCVHCAVNKDSVDCSSELSTKEIKEIIDNAREIGILKIGFTGGEPLLRRDLSELVRYAYDKGFSISVDTNGILLDSNTLLRLKHAGITNINVSIDHQNERFHDRLRKRSGCFRQAIEGIRGAISEGVPCVISTYVTAWRRSKTRLQDIITMAHGLQATAVRVLFPIYSGQLAGKHRHLLGGNDKRDFFKTIADPTFVYSESPLFDYVTGKVECSAQWKLSIYITPDGNVKPCYTSSLSFGNVHYNNLMDILNQCGYSRPSNQMRIDCEPLN